MIPAPGRIATLPDGRRLGFDEYGPPDGFPVLFFHGTPASRIYWRFFRADDLLERQGLRVLALDRPGIGASTPQPGRTHLSWVDDVRCLLDILSLERVSLIAHSGGGPYGLACAVHLPDRLGAVAVVAGTPTEYTPHVRRSDDPGSLWFLRLCAQRPRLARIAMQSVHMTVRVAPNSLMEPATRILPTSDHEIMQVPELRDLFETMIEVTFAQGTRGAQHDSALAYGPWQLPLESVRVPVHLWHGEKDKQVPPEVSRYFRERIPGSTLTTPPDDGHLSILMRRAEDILTVLTPAA